MAVEHLHDDYTEFAADEVAGDTADDGFSINDDSRANWALRKIAQAEANIQRRADFVKAETERLQAWEEGANADDERTIEFFTSHLHAYFDKLREGGALGRRRSYQLPHGRLAVRARQPQFARDNDTLLEWAKATGDDELVRRREEPNWGEIRKRVTVAEDGRTVIVEDTGEIVDGVTASGVGAEAFRVETEVD